MADSTIYFYRVTDIPYGAFSQWSVHPFRSPEHSSVVFETAEQYMMYGKAILFGDVEVAEKILKTTSPAQQKKLGRQVKNFDDDVWQREREKIVQDGNYYKFSAAVDETERKTLRLLLLKTGNKELVEAAPRDRIWGVGFGAANAPANRERWGLNLLGKALMHARDRIRAEESTAET
ncbi:MAG: hypothetical protein M1815_003516 [Lichina confinis]|nr:MAG: hypothetical protein M1815_003516 [Lichina confinis]